MKRQILLCLLLALLLAGCGNSQVEPGNVATNPTVPQPHPDTGFYVPDSEVEQLSGGAVKYYALPEENYSEILAFGENFLLLNIGEDTQMELLVGETLASAVKTKVTGKITAANGSLQIGAEGLAYWNQESGTLVFLNAALRETSRLQMPAEVVGIPWLAPSWNEVYYCTASGIRVLDMQTGFYRTLREENANWKGVTGVLMDGRVLQCEAEGSDGGVTVFVNARTGETVKTGNYFTEVKTSGENWYCAMESGAVREYLVGQGESLWNLWPAEGAQKVFPLPERNAVVTYQETADCCRLDYYDIATGKRSAAVSLSGLKAGGKLCVDGTTGDIWFLVYDRSKQTNGICRWSPESSATEDLLDYRAAHYTRENPDTAGLEMLRQEVEALEKTYGIKLLLGELPGEVTPEDSLFETEYLVQAYEEYLPLLEQALSQFPEDFFRLLAQRTSSKTLSVGLVRSISEHPVGTDALQYWLDGNVYLMLTLGENLEQSFYHGIMHAIETRVLSVTTAYYDWDKLNPEGFVYGDENSDEQYLQDGNAWFANAFAMTSEREDRAFTMEYACVAGNEGLFRSPNMQKKLQMLCKGIRQAFKLQESEEAFLWEQYIATE